MFSKLGIFSIGSGFLVWLFSMISRFMSADSAWADITLSSLSEKVAGSAVDAFSSEGVQDIVYALFYEIQLGWLLGGIGIVFLIISLFAKEH